MGIGVFGGTLDPIHIGHLLIAEQARVSVGLEEVIFIPTGQPWMKGDASITEAHHRMNMVRLAVDSNPCIRASAMEVDRPGPTYTLDTLRGLREEISQGEEIYFILGIDSLKEVGRWKEPATVLELCSLVAAPRPGHDGQDLSFLDEIRPGSTEKVVLLEGPRVDISGTAIRQRVALGLSVRYQVPDAVDHYIHGHGLYRDGAGGER